MEGVAVRSGIFRVGYALCAALLLTFGVRFILGPYGLLPEGIAASVVNRAHGDVDFLHAIHEAGALLVALGLGSAWCAINLTSSRPIHLLLAAAFIGIAVVHWFDVRDVPGGLIAYIGWGTPAAVFALSYLVHPARAAA